MSGGGGPDGSKLMWKVFKRIGKNIKKGKK